MKIIKRNGDLVEFESEKIFFAVKKAMNETELGEDLLLAGHIAEDIYNYVESLDEVISVEEIQDEVERLLAEKGRFDASKQFILYRNERAEKRDKIWEMTDLQKDIYEKKYRFEGESFGEFLDRVSGGNTKVRKLIQDKRFIPAGRILANRGLNERGRKVTYSNCYVLERPQDNLESIFDTAKKTARVYSYGGGVGLGLDNLRPNGATVNNSAKYTTGAVSFMELYSMTTGLIGQNNRRGALILTLPVNHPDIEEFIDIKNDLDKVRFANISVMITDDFMRAVENGEDFKLEFKVKDTGEIISKTINARKLFRKIAESSWKSAEPGVLYWDKVQNYHLNSEIPEFVYVGVNPCGEKPLPKNANCLLSSFNLSEYVLNPFTKQAKFDFEKFKEDIPNVVEFMDELIDEGLPYLPLPENKVATENYRNLGIGIMGLADMFIKMGVTYGSGTSLRIISEIMRVLADQSILASSLLAKKRGTYPKYSKDVLKSEYFLNVSSSETKRIVNKWGLRNAELLSIAPTGSISTMWGVSGGAEPIFALSHNRRSESLGDGEDVVYKVYAEIVKDYMDFQGITQERDLPKYFVTSHEIKYQDRIELQGVLQLFVDSAISSTVNLPNSATVEDVEDLYMLAWKKGLKGVTVYRDGCMREGILTIDEPKEGFTSTIRDEVGNVFKYSNGDFKKVEYLECST